MPNKAIVKLVFDQWKLRWRNLPSTIALLAGAIYAPMAIAAEIEVTSPNEGKEVVITIEGKIVSGDDEKFRNIAAKYSEAIVLLNSEGGAIVPAMDIGRTINLRGYKTAVYRSSSCASACALIWVSGSRRVIFEGGGVGFHASYLDTDGTKLETGLGNALVGRYLTQLGYGEKTVIFATLAPPDKILWLNDETVSMSGIDFDTIRNEPVEQNNSTLSQRQAPPQTVQTPPMVRTVSPPSPDQRSNLQLMGDAKQTIRSPGAFVQALRQKGFQATVSYEDPQTPVITTGIGGNQIALSFSGCDDEGCSYIQLLDYITDATAQEAQLVMNRVSKEEFYSHPIWLDNKKLLAFYNYILIGNDGITTNNLIESMEFFVKTNLELTNIIVEARNR